MWKFVPSRDNETEDEKRVRNINVWHFALMSFIVLWMAGAYLYLNTKTDLSLGTPTLVANSDPIDFNLMDFFTPPATNNLPVPSTNALTTSPPLTFEIKPNYTPGDVIVVKHFYVEAVILEKIGQDSYAIIYKDHNHVLRQIILPRGFLLFPSSGGLTPFSLLVD